MMKDIEPLLRRMHEIEEEYYSELLSAITILTGMNLAVLISPHISAHNRILALEGFAHAHNLIDTNELWAKWKDEYEELGRRIMSILIGEDNGGD